MRKTPIATTLASLILVGASSNSLAQIEEVIVTANKIGAASAQDLPQAIKALDGDQLAQLGATQFDQWAAQVPGLHFEDDGPGDKDYVIRGFNSDLGGTVGVYMDEGVITGRFTQNGGGHQLDIKLHDLDRVEVLKGPQGTLYGANSIAGTIRMITHKPDFEAASFKIEGEVSQTSGAGDNNFNGAAIINLPLIEDTLAARLVVWNHDYSGFIDNVRLNIKDQNNEEASGGRVHIAWKPTDNFDLLLSYTTQDLDSENRGRYTPAGSTYPGSDSPLGSDPLPAITTTKDFQNAEYSVSPWNEKSDLFGITANWELDFGTITATHNQLTRDLHYGFDSTPILIFFQAPVNAVTIQDEDRKLSSSEIRFSSNFDGNFNFVLGAFRQKEELKFDLGVVTVDSEGIPTGPISPSDDDDFFQNGGNSIFGRTYDEELSSTAVFSEANFKINDALEANIGVRWYDSEVQLVAREIHPFFGFGGNPPQFNDRKGEDTNFSTKLNLSWHINDDSLVYITRSEGFRQGGGNSTIVPVVSDIPPTYEADESENWELGIKSDWLDHKLRINAALYRVDWDNMQFEDRVNGFSYTNNVGAAKIEGLEFDVTVAPNEELTLGFGGNFANAELTKDGPSGGGAAQPRKGNEIPQVPNFTGFVFARYEQELSNDMKAHYQMNANYKSGSATEFNTGNDFYHVIDSYAQINLSAGVSNEKWNATLFVNNLSDQKGPIDINENQDNAFSYIPLKPRTIGIRFGYSFL